MRRKNEVWWYNIMVAILNFGVEERPSFVDNFFVKISFVEKKWHLWGVGSRVGQAGFFDMRIYAFRFVRWMRILCRRISQIFAQSSYVLQISQIIFVEKELSCGEILGTIGKMFGNFGKLWEILPKFTRFHVEKNWANPGWKKSMRIFKLWLI